MLGSEIVDRAEARFGDSNNQVYSAAEWLAYVNDAYSDLIAADPLWPFLEARSITMTITAGNNEVALPDDVWRVSAVYDSTNDMPLAPLPGRADYRHYFPDGGSNLALPLYYRLRANTLEVYPATASSVTLHVDTFDPPAAILTNTEPVIPEQYQILLVYGALSHAHLDDENPAQAAAYEARFVRGVERMKNDLLSSRTESFPEIIDLGV